MDTEDHPKRSPEGEEPGDEFQQFLRTLPKERNWVGSGVSLYQGFWFNNTILRPMISFQQHFQARDGDTILVSIPKSGTTWLKALSFSILNRKIFPPNNSPLLTKNPHELVRFFEYDLYYNTQSPDLEYIQDPRIFSTHTPYDLLSPSIKVSNCKIVYVCRNPLDVLVSLWHFSRKIHPIRPKYDHSLSLEEGLEKFCLGINNCGPFWDHVLGYWKESLERPAKVLFLKYEEIKEDTILSIKKMAEFLGLPITEEEEREGLVEEIARLCSIDNLRDLEVNQIGKSFRGLQNGAYFRKGAVGDWVNDISPPMAEKIMKRVEEKLCGSGLTFRK